MILEVRILKDLQGLFLEVQMAKELDEEEEVEEVQDAPPSPRVF
jgi:hypothetical protein